jgi:hypothetical protein
LQIKSSNFFYNFILYCSHIQFYANSLGEQASTIVDKYKSYKWRAYWKKLKKEYLKIKKLKIYKKKFNSIYVLKSIFKKNILEKLKLKPYKIYKYKIGLNRKTLYLKNKRKKIYLLKK